MAEWKQEAIARWEFTFGAWATRPANSLRSRIAWLLRRAATRVDGCESVALHIMASPAISPVTVRRCLHHGFAHATVLLKDEVMSAAVEQAMRDVGWHDGDPNKPSQ